MYFAAIIIIVACVVVWLYGRMGVWCGYSGYSGYSGYGGYGVVFVVATFHFSVLGFCTSVRIGCRPLLIFRF